MCVVHLDTEGRLVAETVRDHDDAVLTIEFWNLMGYEAIEVS